MVESRAEGKALLPPFNSPGSNPNHEIETYNYFVGQDNQSVNLHSGGHQRIQKVTK